MIMRNARQAIHDAFDPNVKSPDMIVAFGEGKVDTNAMIFHGVKAGLIIRAVCEQRTYLRGAALFLNAHDNIINQQELFSLKLKLWLDFQRRVDIDERAMSEVHALSDHLLLGHRYRVWDHQSERLAPYQLAKQVTSTPKAHQRVIRNCNTYLDCLTKLDNQSLQPVWDVIKDQWEKQREAADSVTA